jgi:hypothetical protein
MVGFVFLYVKLLIETTPESVESSCSVWAKLFRASADVFDIPVRRTDEH